MINILAKSQSDGAHLRVRVSVLIINHRVTVSIMLDQNLERAKFDYKSATLPNRKYGVRVAQKKAIYESLTSDSMGTVSTSSIEFSQRPSTKPSSDFSDKITPFCYTSSGYKTLVDKDTQTDTDITLEKVRTLFVALKNKSHEMRTLTGDGRLDLMDILLEFTKIAKEGKPSTKDVDLIETNIISHKTTELEDRKIKKDCFYPKLQNSFPVGFKKPFIREEQRFQCFDVNMKRMTYFQYKEMLDTYAKEKGWKVSNKESDKQMKRNHRV